MKESLLVETGTANKRMSQAMIYPPLLYYRRTRRIPLNTKPSIDTEYRTIREIIPCPEVWTDNTLRCTVEGFIIKSTKTQRVFNGEIDTKGATVFDKNLLTNIAHHGIPMHELDKQAIYACFQIGKVYLHPNNKFERRILWSDKESREIFRLNCEFKTVWKDMTQIFIWNSEDRIYFERKDPSVCMRVLATWNVATPQPPKRTGNRIELLVEDWSVDDLRDAADIRDEINMKYGVIRPVMKDLRPIINKDILFKLKALVQPGCRGLKLSRDPCLDRYLSLQGQLGVCYIHPKTGKIRILWTVKDYVDIKINSKLNPLMLSLMVDGRSEIIFDIWDKDAGLYFMNKEANKHVRTCYRITKTLPNEDIETQTIYSVVEPDHTLCPCSKYGLHTNEECSICNGKGLVSIADARTQNLICHCDDPSLGHRTYKFLSNIWVRQCANCRDIIRHEQDSKSEQTPTL